MPFTLFSPRRARADAGAGAASAEVGVRDEAPSEPPKPPAPKRTVHTYAREAAALVLLASALYIALARAAFKGDPMRVEVNGEDWVGPVGAEGARFLVTAVGIASWLLPLELVLCSGPLLEGKRIHATAARVGGDVVVLAVL